jgi:hypothetical protein
MAKIGKFSSEFNLILKELKKINSRTAIWLGRMSYKYYFRKS